VTWSGLSADDIGESVAGLSEHADRSMQMFGNFDGANVLIEGSNNAANAPFETLNDPSMIPLVYSNARLREILEYVESIRPHVIGGTGSTSVTVIILAKRQRK